MTYSAEVLADSPLLYWKLDETSGTTAADSSGNSRNGTHTNGAAPNATSLLIDGSGKAVDYDGTNDYTTLASAAWMNTTTDLTVECLVYFDNVGTNRAIVFREDADSVTTNRHWSIRINGGALRMGYWDSATSAAGGDRDMGITLAANVTYHLVLTFDGTSKVLKGYVNGKQAPNTFTYTGSFKGATSQPLEVGRCLTTGGAVWHLDGKVDEVAVYGTALSAARVEAHAEAAMIAPDNTYATDVKTDSPLAYYKMDEPGGTTMFDSSGNHRHSVYTGGALTGQTTLLPLQAGKATDFDGTNDYAQVPDAAWMDTSAFTVHALVRPDSTSSYNGLISRDGGAGSRGWNLYILNGNLHCFDATIGGSVATGSVTLSTATTYHVAMVSTGTQVRLYVNGTLDVQVTASVSNTLANPLTIAGSPAGSAGVSFPFNGKMDEVAFIGTALTGTRIGDLYTASQAADAATTITHAANVPGVTSVFNIDVVSPIRTITHAANVPGVTSAFTLLNTVTVTHAANVPGVTSSFQVDAGAVTITHAANVPGVTSYFVLDDALTNVSEDYEDARDRDAIAYAEFDPAVVPVPEAFQVVGADEVVVQARSAVTFDGSQPVYEITEVRAPAWRHRYTSNGRDITYERGAKTPRVPYQLVEPLMYNTGTLTLPQYLAWAEPQGEGDLEWFDVDKPFRVQAVDADNVVQATLYKGWVKTIDPAGEQYTAQLDGEILGRAVDRWRPQEIYRHKSDTGVLVMRAIRHLGGRTTSYVGPTTKIKQYRVGGSNYAHYLLTLLGLAQDRRGRQWTAMPDESGAYDMYRKNTDDIDLTIYLTGNNGLCPYDLHRNLSDEPNRAFATGLSPRGERFLFAIYPGFTQVKPPPPYPGSPIGVGDTGEDVTAAIRRLANFHYITNEEFPGGFDEDVEEAVERFQRRMHLEVTGEINGPTWRHLFDTDNFTPTMQGSQVMPAAALSYTEEFIRTNNGTIVGRNPDYDPTRRPVDIFHDWGAGYQRDRIQDYEEEQLHTDVPNVYGTITVKGGGVIAGTHNPGDPLTEADILRMELVKPGMNAWLPQTPFGPIQVRIGIIDAQADGTYQLSVDSRNRDAMHLSAVINERREVRDDPAASWWKKFKSGRQKEALAEWSEYGGDIESRVELTQGWNIIRLIAGESGTVGTIHFDTVPAAESAVALFGENVWENVLDRLIGDPLTEAGTDKWSDADVIRQLRQNHGLLYQAGDWEYPGGYGAKNPTREDAVLTGEFMEHAGVQYYTSRLPVLYLAVWVDRDCRIRAKAGGTAEPDGGGNLMLPNMEPV